MLNQVKSHFNEQLINFIIVFLIIIVVFIIGALVVSWQRPLGLNRESNEPVLVTSLQTNSLAEELFIASIEEEPANEELGDLIPLPLPAEPAFVVKALYYGSWSASRPSFVYKLIALASSTEINAVVIDIKDFSGSLAYSTDLAQVKKYNVNGWRIKDINSLLGKLAQANIYSIARITVFQDPVLAKARPDLAIQSESKLAFSTASSTAVSLFWLDYSGLAWIDPASQEAWDYNVAIAKDALERGFDEINFDYIRFPSDGDLKDMSFPFWDNKIAKHLVIKQFFAYLREQLPQAKLSVDLFAYSLTVLDDVGIGQLFEDAFDYFDYICPMIYPSHFSKGFLGFLEPAKYPYEIVKDSMDKAMVRIRAKESTAKIRPWLQDFDLGADYNEEMVRQEIQAVVDATGKDFQGFMLWNSWNTYTTEALQASSSSAKE